MPYQSIFKAGNSNVVTIPTELMKELNLKSKPQDITMRQVCAAVGQSILMDTYQSLFGKHNIKIAQILLTYSDFSNQKVFSNFQKGISKMLEMGIVPIINENDPISIDEIGPSFGDNDMLSAMIATSLDIQLLLILTNVDGLFDRNPKENGAVLINEIGDIEKCKKYVDDKSSSLGVGGMRTKIKAAEMAAKKGIPTIIANGKSRNVLLKIFENEEVGTMFPA